jgi:hypothetical protein
MTTYLLAHDKSQLGEADRSEFGACPYSRSELLWDFLNPQALKITAGWRINRLVERGSSPEPVMIGDLLNT